MKRLAPFFILILLLISTQAQGALSHVNPCKSEVGGFCARVASVALAASDPLASDSQKTLGELLSIFYMYGVSIVVISALIVFVAGGAVYMTAGDSSSRIGTARKYMWNAFYGLVLALLSWLILFTINPQLVQELQLNLDPLTKPPGPIIEGGNCDDQHTCQTGLSCVEHIDAQNKSTKVCGKNTHILNPTAANLGIAPPSNGVSGALCKKDADCSSKKCVISYKESTDPSNKGGLTSINVCR